MLLAPFLGGCTRPWSEGIIMTCLGGLIAIRPPHTFGSRPFGLILIGLILLSLTAFLPATWFGLPTWHVQLDSRMGLPHTLSPQPWISLESIFLLITGCVWIAWLQAQSWSLEDHRRLFKLFTAGIALFAGFTLAIYFLHIQIPFWLNTERMFGPFPNRNQTANFFALGAILTVAQIYEAIRARKKSALLWGTALSLLGTALVINYSRGGILVLFSGVALWVFLLTTLSRSLKSIGLGTSILLLMLATFLFFGGETLARFQLEGSFLGFRGLIFTDTFHLIHSAPWCGIGLGNFESLFPLFRSASASDSRILHPESDWLWLCSEMGWPAFLMVLTGLALLAKQVFPLKRATNRRLRAAALAAALATAIHGVVDVSGHRLGTLLPALFILGLALPPSKLWPRDRFAPTLFRCLGLLIAGIGLTWVTAVFYGSPLPGTLAADYGKRQAQELMKQQAYPQAIQSASNALQWKSLDWELYFIRAHARVQTGDFAGATGDFRRARLLETSYAETPWNEGRIWFSRQPSLALLAWREALKRSQPDTAVRHYQEILEQVLNKPALLAQAHPLALGNARLEATWLEMTSPDNFKPDLDALLKLDPQLLTFPDPEQARLFAWWATKSDLSNFIQILEHHPAWQKNGWLIAASAYAAQNNFETACQIAHRFTTSPVLPHLVQEETQRELQRRLLINPADFSASYALYLLQIKSNQEEDALITLEQITAEPKCPAYFYYLLSELHGHRKEWEPAWKALSAFATARHD